jgi:hypothetical protein
MSLADWGHSRESLLHVLSTEKVLPSSEVAIATAHADEIEQDLIDVIERACTQEFDESSARLLFRGLHILGGRRYSAAYRPCVAFLRSDNDRVEELIGDAVTEELPGILAGLFDGDVEPLLALIADNAVDELVRGAALKAFARLAYDGRIGKDFAEYFLERFEEQSEASAGDMIWHEWMTAVALLGLDRLSPRVKAAFADGRIPDWVAGEEHYQEILAAALDRPDDASRFDDEGISYIDDVLQSLERYLPQREAEDVFESEAEDVFGVGLDEWSRDMWDFLAPARNPFRDVGRNDPCPCGSGKKFKKCCLR